MDSRTGIWQSVLFVWYTNYKLRYCTVEFIYHELTPGANIYGRGGKSKKN